METEVKIVWNRFVNYKKVHAISLKKKIEIMNKRHQESYENAKISYIYKEKFRNKCLKDKRNCKARDH